MGANNHQEGEEPVDVPNGSWAVEEAKWKPSDSKVRVAREQSKDDDHPIVDSLSVSAHLLITPSLMRILGCRLCLLLSTFKTLCAFVRL